MTVVPRATEPGPVDIDASIWVAAYLGDASGHQIALRLIGAVLRKGVPIEQPTMALVEVASALRRRGTDRAEVERRVAWLARLQGCTFHDLDFRSSIDAVGTVIATGLRAADAVYLVTARHTGATLITFDEELLAARLPGVRVMSPEAWLDAYS